METRKSKVLCGAHRPQTASLTMDVDIVSHKVMTTRFQCFYQIHRYRFSKSGSEKDPEVMKFTESLN